MTACSRALTVSGPVTDESGNTLRSITVLFKHTGTATVTDLDGQCSLLVPQATDILVFCFTRIQHPGHGRGRTQCQ
ncbi:MAG: hypothetical protein RLY31_100 [Bacteroidota bacterium]|jgi:hypothetical protein